MKPGKFTEEDKKKLFKFLKSKGFLSKEEIAKYEPQFGMPEKSAAFKQGFLNTLRKLGAAVPPQPKPAKEKPAVQPNPASPAAVSGDTASKIDTAFSSAMPAGTTMGSPVDPTAVFEHVWNTKNQGQPMPTPNPVASRIAREATKAIGPVPEGYQAPTFGEMRERAYEFAALPPEQQAAVIARLRGGAAQRIADRFGVSVPESTGDVDFATMFPAMMANAGSVAPSARAPLLYAAWNNATNTLDSVKAGR